MRLLYRNDEGRFAFKNRTHETYAILSHTWGHDEDEVTYQDIESARVGKSGYMKINFCLNEAERQGYKYVWIDSCCINRLNNTELGKSINLMFKYYTEAAVCLVYLADINDDQKDGLLQSRWFTRGWTLQELVAPTSLQFFSSNGRLLGDKHSFAEQIKSIGIDTSRPLQHIPLLERFKWSFSRQTKEPEDLSYSLVGLLEVSVTATYGEQEEGARERLFEAVTKEYGSDTSRPMQEAWISRAWSNRQPRHDAKLTSDKLMNTLKFSSMDSRRANISEPFSSSCDWLLSHVDFTAWKGMSSHKQLLWIQGNAGTGKSVLMKFAQSRCQDVSIPCITFFFNARGSAFDRSVQELEIQHLVNFFESAIDSGVPIYVCFASRYYPTIASKHCVELALEQQSAHDRAIDKFMDGNLDAKSMTTERAADLRARISAKANGGFLWATLVTRSVNAKLSQEKDFDVEARLSDLPLDLNDLFTRLVKSSKKLARFRLSVLWILFNSQALSAVEYHDAMSISTSLATSSTVDFMRDLSPRPGRPASAGLEQFIADTSENLAHTTTDGKVEFIHESVRDFFFKHEGLQVLCLDSRVDGMDWHYDQLKTLFLAILHVPHPKTPPWLKRHAEKHIYQCAEQASHSIPQDDFIRYVQQRPLGGQYYAQIVPGFCTAGGLDGLRAQLIVANAQSLLARVYALFHGKDAAYVAAQDMEVALFFNRKVIVQMLFDYGADVEAIDGYGQSRLVRTMHHGYTWGKKDLMEVLLERGANADAKDTSGNTCLLLAVLQGDQEMAQLLLTHNADVNYQDYRGDDCLYHAWMRNDMTMVRLLLEHGANVDNEWATPWLEFHYMSGIPEAYSDKPLGLSNTNLDLTVNDEGQTLNAEQRFWAFVCVDEARRCIEFARLLTQYGASMTIDIAMAFECPYTCDYGAAAVMLLLDGSDPNWTQVSTGRKAIHLACRQGIYQTDTAIALLHFGAEVDATDDNGITALMVAAEADNHKHVHLLLQRSADPYLRNSRGKTALSIACKHIAEKSINALVRNGIIVDVTNPSEMEDIEYYLSFSGADPKLIKWLTKRIASARRQVAWNKAELQSANAV